MQRTSDTLTEILTVVVIGVIGGFIAFLGAHLDTTIIYLVGMVILISSTVVAAGNMILSIFELIEIILDFKNHFRNQHRKQLILPIN